MTPSIVAVIVNYNSGALLERAVASLLEGTIRPRVEVVDNASSDDSVDRLKERGHPEDLVNITVNASNAGFARANNQVLSAGDADYYLLLNPDCVVDGHTLEELVGHLRDRPEIGLAGGRLLNPDGTVQRTSKRRFPTPWSGLARTLGLHRFVGEQGRFSDFDVALSHDDDNEVEPVEAISGAMMFARGEALERVGLLDEGYFMHCEDLDWCKRFWESGYQVAYVPGATAVHDKGGSGRGPRVVWHLHKSMMRFYNKHYRQQYPAWFSVLVYAAVWTRCAVLMGVGALRG